jgi:hypothetical protein
MYHIYIKATDMKKFKAMDLSTGCEVDKLIYASMIPDEKAEPLLQKLKTSYPSYEFKLKKLKGI